MFTSKNKPEQRKLRYKLIEEDTRRKFENSLNKMVNDGWEPINDTYRVTPVLGGITGKSTYTILVKK